MLSSRSCKSSSVIFALRLGISSFASSAVSQQRLPIAAPLAHHFAIRQWPRMEPRQVIFTELRSLEVHQLSPCIQHLFYRFNVLFCFKSRENVEVVGGLVEDTEEGTLAAAISLPQKPSFCKQHTRDLILRSEKTYSPSLLVGGFLRWLITALMSRRASDRVSVGTFANSPSLSCWAASSSPVGFSRVRVVT